jgi:hypothetical protein
MQDPRHTQTANLPDPGEVQESRQVRRARERRKDKVISALDKINRSHQRMQAQALRRIADHPGYEEDLL